jgi:methionine-rich copper-binding protein CopC
VLQEQIDSGRVLPEVFVNRKQWWIAALVFGFSCVAYAHTHLKSSAPVDNSTVESAPSKLELHFSEAARLTALSIQAEGGAEQKLSPLPPQPAADASVSLPTLASGKYVVSWRVIGDDSHVMAGKLHFTVAAPAKAATATSR